MRTARVGAALSADRWRPARRSGTYAREGLRVSVRPGPPVHHCPSGDAVSVYRRCDTPMQAWARSQPVDLLPSRDLFLRFEAERLLVPPEAPAAEIVSFLESEHVPRFQERRLGA